MQMPFCFHTITAKPRLYNTQLVVAAISITKSIKTEGINKSMNSYIIRILDDRSVVRWSQGIKVEKR